MRALIPLILVGTAQAQTELFSRVGAEPAGLFGYSVRDAGDVDADGMRDIVIGSPGVGAEGAAYVFSGADGTQIFEWLGSGLSGGSLGSSVAGVGDLNGDGHADVAVARASTPFTAAPLMGQVRVYSGSDGSLLHFFSSLGSFDDFGSGLAGGEDVTGDGVPDILVGARLSSSGGRAFLYDGAGGSLVRFFAPSDPSSMFGAAVAFVGDANGDGVSDVAIGAPLDGPVAGRVFVYSGADGALLFDYSGNSLSRLGWSVDGAGDWDGDGAADVLVGAPLDRTFPSLQEHGRVVVLSGATGAVLHESFGTLSNANYGTSVAGGADFDGDAFPDLLIGAARNGSSSRVHLLSGQTGGTLEEITGLHLPGTTSELGFSVDVMADQDGDGRSEALFSSLRQVGGGQNGGEVILLSRQGFETVTCDGEPNSLGLPGRLRVYGSPQAASNRVVFLSDQTPPLASRVLVNAPAAGFVMNPGGSDGNLCLGSSPFRHIGLATSSFGNLDLTFQYPDLQDLPRPGPMNHVVQAGETWFFQLWYRDTAPGSSNWTNAISIQFE